MVIASRRRRRGRVNHVTAVAAATFCHQEGLHVSPEGHGRRKAASGAGVRRTRVSGISCASTPAGVAPASVGLPPGARSTSGRTAASRGTRGRAAAAGIARSDAPGGHTAGSGAARGCAASSDPACAPTSGSCTTATPHRFGTTTSTPATHRRGPRRAARARWHAPPDRRVRTHKRQKEEVKLDESAERRCCELHSKGLEVHRRRATSLASADHVCSGADRSFTPRTATAGIG